MPAAAFAGPLAPLQPVSPKQQAGTHDEPCEQGYSRPPSPEQGKPEQQGCCNHPYPQGRKLRDGLRSLCSNGDRDGCAGSTAECDAGGRKGTRGVCRQAETTHCHCSRIAVGRSQCERVGRSLSRSHGLAGGLRGQGKGRCGRCAGERHRGELCPQIRQNLQ